MRLHQKPADAVELGIMAAAGEPHQRQAAHGQADGAQRHQPQPQLLAAQFGAQHRACGDADGKKRQHQVEHIIVAAQMNLRKRGQLGGVNRADKPKPRNADNGGGERWLGKGLPQQIQRAFYNIDFDFGVGRFGGHGGHKKAAERAQNGDGHHQ